MASVFLMRLAVALAGGGARVLRTSEGPGAEQLVSIPRWVEQAMGDSSRSDAELTEAVNAAMGYDAHVATFTGDFELRRLQINWVVKDALVGQDDVRVATMDWLKLTAGEPDDVWEAADFTALASNITTWWTAIDQLFTTNTTLHTIKVYKVGPNISPPQPPVYENQLDLVAPTAGNMLPPQVAISVTEMAGSKPHWGRFYLPSPAVSATNAYGRLNGVESTIADATDVLYTAMAANGRHAVVYRRPLPERTTKSGSVLPARSASAWTVDTIQVDDVFDVIRSRRWKYPLLRVQRAI